MSLSWSPPSVSPDHTELVDFQYEVALANLMNPSEPVQLTTSNTNLTVSRLQITKHHTACSNYTWSVATTVEERTSETVANETFAVQTGLNKAKIITN